MLTTVRKFKHSEQNCVRIEHLWNRYWKHLEYFRLDKEWRELLYAFYDNSLVVL